MVHSVIRTIVHWNMYFDIYYREEQCVGTYAHYKHVIS